MLSWPRPKHETMSWVHEAGFYALIVETEENWVYDYACEILGEEFFFLLGVSSCSVCVISFLEFFLGFRGQKLDI
jgi:hypothetical protein